MSDRDDEFTRDADESIAAAFDAYRHDVVPMLRSAGLAPVRLRVRHRQQRRLMAVALLVVAAIAVPLALVDRDRPAPHPPAIATSPSPRPSPAGPTPLPTPSPSPAGTPSGSPPATVRAPACAASQLVSHPGPSGSVANQPFEIIDVVNRSGTACSVTGYPKLIDVRGARPPHPAGSVAVSIRNGANFEVDDPGPGTVVLAAGGVASFAIGTGTAYESPIDTLTSARLVIGTGSISVTLTIQANGPPGRPFPMTVTAYAAGGNAGR
jgi:hypothetical protein